MIAGQLRSVAPGVINPYQSTFFVPRKGYLIEECRLHKKANLLCEVAHSRSAIIIEWIVSASSRSVD